MCGFPRKRRNPLICREVELGKWKKITLFLESQTHFSGMVSALVSSPFWFRFDCQNWAGERLLRRGPKWLSWPIEVHTAVRKYFSHYDACFMYVNLYGHLHTQSSNAEFHPLLVLSWSDLTKLCVFFLKVCQRKTPTNTLSFCSSVYSPRKLTWNLRKKAAAFSKGKSFSKVRRSLLRSCSTC